MTVGSTGDILSDERIFRLLVQGVVDYAIYMLDPTGRVVSWNPGALRIKGYEAHEVVGQHFSMFYGPEDRSAGLPDRALAAARSEGRYAAEGWRVRKDGSRFFASVVIDAIHDDGELIGFAKITRDISERRAAETALSESERRFRMLVDGVTDYALYMLDPTGAVTNWNSGGQKIKGYYPDEIIGQHFSRFYTPADRTAGRPARALKLAAETGRYEEEGWRVRKDGTFFWASVIIDRIADPDGNLIGFAKITRDITERKKAQDALETVQRQLAESQKLDALGQLTGGVAHDFNNLLMIVLGNISTLKRIAGEDERGIRAVSAIESAVKRGSSLTRQLLTFARRQHLNPEPVDLNEKFKSIQEILSTALGRAFDLRVNVAEGIWPVTVDSAELETAIVNLVINARDAMPDGGVISLNAANLPDSAPRCVEIRIQDHGTGIPPDVLSKVFDPFFTTKPSGKGTGLGLSQVHGFAHQAGGRIEIISELGAGTTFQIILPSVPNHADCRCHNDVRSAILVVDDNPDVAAATAGLLEQLGYTAVSATCASDAFTVLQGRQFQAVISDIVMPGDMDGVALANAIRAKYPALPVLLSTGYNSAAAKATGFPILPKPYELPELGRALSRLLDTTYSAK